MGLLSWSGYVNASTPTVNGLFYGDGDDAYYQLYATSYYGSGLYNYFDPVNNRLYVALVVDHSVNDMVCSSAQGNNRNYTDSAGWNNPMPCHRKVDSEFAEFTLACAPSSANNWTWRQRVGDPLNGTAPESDWVSTASCTAGSCTTFGTDGAGLSMEKATSWTANVNAYQSEYPYALPWPLVSGIPWNMYVTSLPVGSGNNSWKSPFVTSGPLDVTQVPGYPVYTTYDQLQAGHTASKGWEWTMVYEWSVDLGPAGADCGSEPIWLITGLSHHSPLKDPQFAEECDIKENDCFPEGGENDPPQILSDWGDLPNSYGTTFASNGARHYIIVNNAFLGETVQSEPDGQPSMDATGDGTEEDGIVFLTPFVPGGEALIQVTAGTAGYLSAFVDFNNDGTLEEVVLISATGQAAVTVGTIGDTHLSAPGVYTLRISIPDDATGVMYSRFRFTNAANQGGKSPVGRADTGEVEDYALASVGDFVWLDENGNGVQDSGESGVAGVEVRLLDADGDPVLGADGEPVTTTTNVDGYYEFPGVPPGDYRIGFAAQSFTTQEAGADTDLDSDPDPATGITPVFSLSPGQTRTDIDAGLTEIPTAVSISEIGLGTVRVDEFLEYIGAGESDEEGLRILLASWDPGAVPSDSGREDLWQSLVEFLDPDGDGRVAILRWETMEERGTIGFYVDRRGSDGTWKRINDTLLPGLITAPMGGEYWLADPAARAEITHEYRLIEQEARGNLREYGPFRLRLPE